jgi:hypothetical protein
MLILKIMKIAVAVADAVGGVVADPIGMKL